MEGRKEETHHRFGKGEFRELSFALFDFARGNSRISSIVKNDSRKERVQKKFGRKRNIVKGEREGGSENEVREENAREGVKLRM